MCLFRYTFFILLASSTCFPAENPAPEEYTLPLPRIVKVSFAITDIRDINSEEGTFYTDLHLRQTWQ
ncbi:hypothetical protein [Teredinibacter purpureus]|uniref:hypothetical protein n=1 Tax=Teredinibacter purpureus TaxID=2731756 RepID=UPI0005F7BD25|nr:hypothetical protein [Teredinibacter purpureus]